MHNTAVGKGLNQPVGEGGFPSIGYAAQNKTIELNGEQKQTYTEQCRPINWSSSEI